MTKVNGAQSIQVIPDRRVIVSAGKGKTNIEELIWLKENVLAEVSKWKALGWAYIADCSEMKPVSATESGELVKMTKAFVDAGCLAFGFAEGHSILLKIQAQKNTERSETGIPEGHFATVEEALNWVKETVHV